jgi:hypothetical protein
MADDPYTVLTTVSFIERDASVLYCYTTSLCSKEMHI